MTNKEIMDLLVHYCSVIKIDSRCVNRVRELLVTDADNIDLTADRGSCFRSVMARDSVEMLKVLLDFYTKSKLQGAHDSEEYLAAQSELYDILEEGVDSNEISSEMQILINKYLYYDAYSDIEDEDVGDSDALSEDSDMSSGSSKKSSLTEENLKHWNELHMQLLPLELMGQSKTLVDIADQQEPEIMSRGAHHAAGHEGIELSGATAATLNDELN
jgi:hypothetical protein